MKEVKQEKGEEKLVGKVTYIIFEANGGGFKILRLRTKDDSFVVKGVFPEIMVGDGISCFGYFVEDSQYGLQFNSKICEKLQLDEQDKIKRFLSSGNIKGVGEKLAQRIIDKFGEDTEEVLLSDPLSLSTVKGLSYEKAEEIIEEYANSKEIYNVYNYLKQYNLSEENIANIYKEYGNNTIDIVQDNPYILLDVLKGKNFKTIDNIAVSQGMAIDSQKRIQALIKEGMKTKIYDGDTVVLKNEIIDFVKKHINAEDDIDCNDEYILDEIINLKVKDEIYEIDDFLTFKQYALAQEYITKKIKRMLLGNVEKIKSYDKKLEKAEKDMNISLTNDQKKGIKSINENNISIITGGPGTGKTTIIKTIITLFEENDKQVVVAAPTGKAAKRIEDVTKHRASTIHRLLGLGRYDETDTSAVFLDTQEIDADLVIIDEASMIDIFLFNYILVSIKPGTKLVLIGDVDQIQSVGSGNILYDLIQTGKINVVRLKEIFRQALESRIIVNTHRVNNGQELDIEEIKKDKESDLKIIEVDTNDEIKDKLFEILDKKKDIFKFFKQSIILTPTKKGVCGIDNLNRAIQEKYNVSEGKIYGKIEFRKKDRVMQIKNNYEKEWEKDGYIGLGIFNGDTGSIKKVDNVNKEIVVDFDDEKQVVYEFKELEELQHAYSLTIHKSQGSEFDEVILVLPKTMPKLLSRNILYTAMSRAKKKLIIISNKETLKFMIHNIDNNERKTILKSRILKSLKKM